MQENPNRVAGTTGIKQNCPNKPECMVCGQPSMSTGVLTLRTTIMLLEENMPEVFLHFAFVAKPHVYEAAVYIHPVSHSLGFALFKKSFLPDTAKFQPHS